MTNFLGGADSRFQNVTFATATLDESWHVHSGRRDFSHRRRGEAEYGSRGNFFTLWSNRSSLMSGDLSAGYDYINRDASSGTGRWSVWQTAARGGNGLKFIMGYCVDVSNVAIGGAVVQAFLTMNDQFVRQTACDDRGYYEVGTEYTGAQHYLVAYVPGSPDKAGTTVNTLTPTNRDGT